MEEGTMNVEVIWRGMKLNVEVNSRWTVGQLGKKLSELTNVKPDTMRLLVPQLDGKGSSLLSPFSDDTSRLEIQVTGIIKGKPVRMMGVFEDEIIEVSQNNTRPDLRIAGFEEEDKRLRQLSSYAPQASLKLPQGPYIFCDYRTLDLPGIKLNPPPHKALRIMHILACDPGIIAIMNKHRWRVGIITELAPVGYVGISPKCILGFNKNHGEEISLRLRTDDLLGFRKYDSIKKTLLHELAHMVHSEHDSKFLALEKQLNEEAVSLDWTKSMSHTLSGGSMISNHSADDTYLHDLDARDVGHKLGGSESFATARASSVAAAYLRSRNSSTSGTDAQVFESEVDDGWKKTEPETDDNAAVRLAIDVNVHPGLSFKEPHEIDNKELWRIKELIMKLRSELTPHVSASVLRTLSVIIRNVLEHPEELKFRRIRKANAHFQRNVANYKAAMEFLHTVGFEEDEAYVVLQTNDTSLLRLADASLHKFIS